MRKSNQLIPLGSAAQARHEQLTEHRRLFTDIGNAEKLAVHLKGLAIFVHGEGWLRWDGKRWEKDSKERVLQFAKEMMHFFLVEARAASDQGNDELAKEFEAHFKRSSWGSRVRACLDLAKSEPDLRKDVSELDSDPDVLNVQNGILDLRTLDLREHDNEALLTKVTNASFDQRAECPFWEESLERFLPDGELRRWVQRAAGYSMLGSYSEWLFIPHGPGANFKSTFLWTLRYVLGGYACEAAPELLTERRERGAREDAALADLRGTRLVTTIETAQGKRMAEALMKQLTGESTIKAKYMRQDYFEFENQAAVWLATNHKPVVQGTDYAAWRRIRLMPFEVTISEADRMDAAKVKAKLKEERDGILRWLVNGLRAYKERGSLDPAPAAVDVATTAYREEMDVLGQWFEECCERHAERGEAVAEVRGSYVKYCEENGINPVGVRSFNEQLEERGFKRGTVRVGAVVDGGIGLKNAKGWLNLVLKAGS